MNKKTKIALLSLLTFATAVQPMQAIDWNRFGRYFAAAATAFVGGWLCWRYMNPPINLQDKKGSSDNAYQVVDPYTKTFGNAQVPVVTTNDVTNAFYELTKDIALFNTNPDLYEQQIVTRFADLKKKNIIRDVLLYKNDQGKTLSKLACAQNNSRLNNTMLIAYDGYLKNNH